mgnify:CR=1 FL=1
MFEKSKDLGASEQEFLQIFKDYDDSIKRELMSAFVSQFKKLYGSYKKGHEKRDISTLADSVKELESAAQGRTPIEEATFMGGALGAFLGIMEYKFPTAKPTGLEAYTMLASARKIARALKRMDKKIKLKFIKNRINTIAKKHKGQLSPQVQEFYARIAAMFA